MTTELKSPKSALTIVFQSWATPIVGLVMLLVGLAGGFYLRPLISPSTTSVPTPAQEDQSKQTLQEYVVSQTLHFIGDPDAPVTIIEFSDFQ